MQVNLKLCAKEEASNNARLEDIYVLADECKLAQVSLKFYQLCIRFIC